MLPYKIYNREKNKIHRRRYGSNKRKDMRWMFRINKQILSVFRKFPLLMAAEIVGVQDMTTPVGQAFKLRYDPSIKNK